MINKALFSSNSDEWATPLDVYEKLDAEFSFNLDPCASDINHKCDTYFTAENDGLSHTWGGTECFAIRLIARLISGLKRHIEKAIRIIHLLFCLFLQEQTQGIFITLFLTEQK